MAIGLFLFTSEWHTSHRNFFTPSHVMKMITFELSKALKQDNVAQQPTKSTENWLHLRSVLYFLAPFSIPALIYAVNNNLFVHIQAEMDAATFQVGTIMVHLVSLRISAKGDDMSHVPFSSIDQAMKQSICCK